MALALRASCSALAAKRPTRPAVARLPLRKVAVRASAEPTPTSSPQVDEAVAKAKAYAEESWTWIKARWAATEDAEKPAVIGILFAVVFAQIAIGVTIDKIDKIPLLSTVLELVGLAVTGTFVYKLVTDETERDTVKGQVSSFLDKVTGGK